MVAPAFTPMSVAKPWMLDEPAPSTSHSAGSVPGFVFSHGMGLTLANEHGSVVARTLPETTPPPARAPSAATRNAAKTLRPEGSATDRCLTNITSHCLDRPRRSE